jgi:hypothetical protein
MATTTNKYSMFLAVLTMFTALAISAVAIYYSVAGLAAIFAAAVVPIIIMGGVLEVAKLVTAVWLHRYWDRAVWWLRSYLAIAVFILMLITSMGIFGFLSKAHIEQTSMGTEQIAQIETLEENLARSQSKVTRWNEELDRLLNGGSGFRVDNLLTSNQQELDTLYERIDKDKTAEREQAKDQIEQQSNRLEQAGNRKTQDLDAAVDTRDAALAQAERYNTGGIINNQTDLYNDAVKRANDTYDQRVGEIESQELGVASAAQREIRNINSALADTLTAIDNKYKDQTDQLIERIASLRNETNSKTDDIDSRINELEDLVEQEQDSMGLIREDKAVLETQYRMLEAEVGPVKYIAEFVYGETADQDLLEEAVRWVIITIIIVFDPLAVLLLIASQYTFRFRDEDNGNIITDTTDQPDPEPTPPSPGETPSEGDSKDTAADGGTTDNDLHLQQQGTTRDIDSTEPIDQPSSVDDAATAVAESYAQTFDQKKTEYDLDISGEIPVPQESKKKELELSVDEVQKRTSDYKEAERTAHWNEAKKTWKEDNPNETLKEHKKRYILGHIEELPWEKYVDDNYVQNQEQTENSIWQRIKKLNE